MIRTRTFQRFLLLTLAVAALAPFSACSGSGSGGDDDDDGTIEPTHCQILWSNLGSSELRYDVYVIDMPIDLWVTGEQTYTLDVSDEVVAIFYDEYDFENLVYAARGITTSGTFNVTLTGTSTGLPVQLSDPGAQQFFDINGSGEIGNFVGSGGIATFDGNWSDPDPDAQPDAGTGSVVLTYMGANLEIGTSFVNYAICYEDDSFAPMTPAQRIERQFVRRLRN